MIFLARLWMVPFLVSALLAKSGAPPQTHPPILPKAEFHTGEAARFTFSGNVSIQPNVNPRFSNAAGLAPHPRQYKLEGSMVATFLGMSSGQILSGTLRFENLRVSNWVSESDVKELESRLDQMKSNSWTISREMTLTGTRVVPRSDPYTSDLDELLALAQLALIPQMGDQPLAPGDRKDISRTAGAGSITPGAQTSVAIEYLADVSVDRHPFAEFRVTTSLPLQQLLSPPEWAEKLAKAGAQPLSRASSETSATYLYDPDSRAFEFLRLKSHVEVRIEAESGDANAPVRIPVTIVTHTLETAFNAERVNEPTSTAREADLAAFGKSLEPSSPSTTGLEITAENTNPSGEMSLGDLARKTRAQNEAQGKPGKELTLDGASFAGAIPPGFKTFTYPRGGMTALVPLDSQSAPSDAQGSGQRFVARVGTPPVLLVIVMGQGPPPGGDANAPGSMEIALQALFGSKARFVNTRDTTLGDRPAKIGEFIHEKTSDMPALRGLAGVAAASDGKSLGALICLSSEKDYPTAEAACRTIVESMRMP